MIKIYKNKKTKMFCIAKVLVNQSNIIPLGNNGIYLKILNMIENFIIPIECTLSNLHKNNPMAIFTITNNKYPPS